MAAEQSSNPLRAFLDVRRGEWPLALTMAGYFFLVIGTFWILKPLKKVVFNAFYEDTVDGLHLGSWHLAAEQAELIAKLGNMVVAALAVVVFSALSNRLRRQQLTHIFNAFFAALFVVFALTIHMTGHWLAWSFYFFGDLYSTLMVATFFAFLNDSVRPEAARRLYGMIVFGGVAGGAFGSTFLSVWAENGDGWWMWVCLGIAVLISVLAAAAGHLVDKSGLDKSRLDKQKAVPEEKAERDAEMKAEASSSNPALAGAKLVFASRYLLAIVAIVGLYEIVSTILDFQFTATINHFFEGDAEGRKSQFLSIYAVTNIAGMVIQLLFTGFVMSKFRLHVALLITPFMILLGSTGFLLLPLLWPGSLLSTYDNALNYSVNQSAREALYTPTTREEKYKAKAFIDMFVQRFAKSIAVLLSLAITTIFDSFAGVRWLSILAIVITAVWAWSAFYAGRRFHALTAESDEAGDKEPAHP
jgi:AAA family ATP:ADP antiporter